MRENEAAMPSPSARPATSPATPIADRQRDLEAEQQRAQPPPAEILRGEADQQHGAPITSSVTGGVERGEPLSLACHSERL